MKKVLMFLAMLLIMPKVYAYSDYIIASGENIGIKANSNGVLIIGTYNIENTNIALNSGLKIGDRIISINDNKISTVEELLNNISVNMKIGYIRNNKTYYTNLRPIYSNGSYKTGLYVKDSIIGIGTLTYIDPNTKIFGSLGHEIIESNTGEMLELKDGNIFESNVTKIIKSSKGIPGSKQAKLNYNNIYGSIIKNTNKGLFGTYEKNIDISNLYKVGTIDDIKIGKASILTVIEGNKVDSFEINILKVSDNSTKSILFEITDKELLNKTNGVVQGMSGSPIIQDDYIIGAVTHVIVDSPTKGYGILITNMLEEGEN